jgi:8-oxo-dGTP pyrophosphatase MutT (NUDIX family)
VTGSRTVYENRWMRLREDRFERADGSEGLYAVVEKAPATVVLPVDGPDVVLVEQYRHPVGARFWELPQGAWDGEDQPDPEELARGELAEETGLRAGSMTHLGHLYEAYGYATQGFDVYLATDLTEGTPDREASERDMIHHAFTDTEITAMIRSGQIVDAPSLAALTLYRLPPA